MLATEGTLDASHNSVPQWNWGRFSDAKGVLPRGHGAQRRGARSRSLFFLSDHFRPHPITIAQSLQAIAEGRLPQDIEYKDFVAILLTAVIVMLAVLTAVLALFAVWGFSVIRDEARVAAEREAAKVARDVAGSVAARTALEATPTETTANEAGEIAQAMNDGGNPNGGD